ncbi:AMP-binding protein [Timonella sp. A28]|uniref:AMP-binding protein n=1 Tax=Timonella sp. A28 TaxID=3442640 RepID=UPI003EBF35C2
MTALHTPLINETVALTEAQRGVLSAQLISPDSPLFTVGEAVHLIPNEGHTIDDERLQSAIHDALTATAGLWLDVSQHETEKKPTLRQPQTTQFVDVRDITDPEPWLTEHMQFTYDLNTWPLHTHTILRLPNGTRIWVFRAHHVLVDGYAISQIIAHALTLYAGEKPHEYVHPSQVTDEENTYRNSPAFRKDKAYWAELGKEFSAARLLPGITETSPAAVRIHTASSFSLNSVLSRCNELNTTWVELTLAALAVHMSRQQGTTQAVVGIPLMNRFGSAAAQSPTMFTNVLPLVIDVQLHHTVRELVENVSTRLTQLRRHGRYRSEELQRDLGLVATDRLLTATEANFKLFEYIPEIPDATVRIDNLAEGPLDDLSLSLTRTPQGHIAVTASGPQGTHKEELNGHTQALLETLKHVATAPAHTALTELPVALTPIEHAETHTWCDPAAHFATTATATPHNIALVTADTTLTYKELNYRVAQQAGRYQAAGITQHTFVGIDLERSPEYVIALLAVQRIGAVPVALHSSWPTTRKHQLMERLGSTILLSKLNVPEHAELVFEPTPAHPLDLAYVIHTSGSTGLPKAVGATRQGLGHLVAYHHTHGLFAETDRTLRVGQSLPLAFDGSWDTLQGVLLGHEVHLIDLDIARDPAAFIELLEHRRIDVIDTMPSFVAAALNEGLFDREHYPTRISVGGEACSTTLWQQLRANPTLRIFNLYGPTEFTVDALGARGTDSDEAVIGHPLSDTTALILDSWLHPTPPGVHGELYLSGIQEARGYLRQSALTAERFVANPYGTPGSRMYRTGDVVSLTADGLVRYHGRKDSQVKIRGYRIEPAEVETALTALPNISNAVVRVHEQRLIAYVVSAQGKTVDVTQVRTQLAYTLPDHLVPAAVHLIDSLPLTANGKVDTKALPLPEKTVAPAGRPAQTPQEHAVLSAMEEVLNLTLSGVDADFFSLGGDSITAIQTVAALRRNSWASTVRSIFEDRTVANIAANCTPAQTVTPQPTSPLIELSGSELHELNDLMNKRTRRRSAL